MPQNQTLITQIDTPVTGASGAFLLSPAGADGNIGQPGSETLSGIAFTDPTGFSLSPTANGGNGSAGVAGNPGTNAAGTSTTSGGVTSVVFANGGDGQAGGSGGDGGGGSLDVAGFMVGSIGTHNDLFSITATANGGAAAIGAFGGSGGGSGYDSEAGTPVNSVLTGNTPGSGAAGGAGGSGGSASSTIDTLTDISLDGVFARVVAQGAAGVRGGVSGGGGEGGFTSDGGVGGIGGFGGDAVATLSGSDLADTSETNVSLLAAGGAGGNGGQSGEAGFSLNDGINDDITTTSYGANPIGGTGGNAGSARAVLTGNNLSAPIIAISMTAISGTPGSGGNGTSQVSSHTTAPGGGIVNVNAGAPGPTGATGSAASESLSMTDNVVTIGTVNAGFGSGDPDSVALALNIGSSIAASPNAVPLDGTAGGNLTFSGNSFTGTGRSEFSVAFMGGGVTLDTMHDSISIAGSASNAMTGFTTFRLGDDDTVVIGAGGPYTIIPATDPDVVMLTPGHGNTTIDSATTTDLVLQFQGYGSTLDNLSQLLSDTAQNGGNVVISIPGDGTVMLPQSSWTPTAQDTVLACFAAGTAITTPTGEVAVERLRAGDLVLSAFGDVVPVQWVGHRHVHCHRQPYPEQTWPVCIAAGAFASDQPLRDLFLSPDHAFYVDGYLVPVKCLVNGTTVAPMPVDQITYFHIELPRHDVLLAEGLPCESYLDTGNRSSFANGGAVVTMAPAFGSYLREAQACADLRVTGPVVEAVRNRLAMRTALRAAQTLTDELQKPAVRRA